jgi:hypothetical protein
MATVLTFPERVTEYSLAKLKQRVAAGALVLVEQRSLVFGRWPPGGGGGAGYVCDGLRLAWCDCRLVKARTHSGST